MARKSKENKTVKKITDRKEIAALKKVEAPVLKKKRHMPKTSNDEIKEKAAAILKNALSGYNDLNLLAKKASVYQKDNVFTTLSNQTAGRNLKIDEELRRLEYNFTEIGKFEDMESIVSRAFSRKKELAIKQGYSIVSKNKKNLDFVKSRMLEIEEKSRMTTSEFIKQVISDLVSRHNAFIWKRRGKSVNPAASSYKINGQVKEPIESLVVVPPECVKYIWDTKKLEVKSWVLDGYDVEVPYEDIIHLHVNRKTGFVAGTPSVVAVIQDILALRRTEQNLEIFIHLFVFPIIVYMLAESDDNDISNIDFDGEDIIVKAQEVLNQMMNNGGAVLPPGDEIEIKSASNNIDYKTFLNHIKARVFTGLGVSSVDMGEGDSTNRATAETLSSVIIDSVKSIQKIIVDKINSELFRDILRENRTLKPEDVYIEKNIVQLFFNEIDLYYLIKYENHNSMMFAQNVITHTEARNRIGLDPLPESDKKGLFSIMFESVNEGAASATVATANPSNQHGSDSIKTQLLLEYTKELVENNIELNKELYDAFDTRFTQYNKKHLLDSCSPELFNVKISVAKSYFRQLANTVTN